VFLGGKAFHSSGLGGKVPHHPMRFKAVSHSKQAG
jgi:hypothetical protein